MMQNSNQTEELQGTIAVLVDTRKLAQRCQQLEEDLELERKQRVERDETIERMKRDSSTAFRYAELGRCETERQKKETISRLAAIVHFTGERDRLRSVQRMLSDETLDPGEIAAIHGRISEEFRALYPAQPLSRAPVEIIDSIRSTTDWSEYRIQPKERNHQANRNNHSSEE